MKSPPQDACCGCVVAGGGAPSDPRKVAWAIPLLALGLRAVRRRRRA